MITIKRMVMAVSAALFMFACNTNKNSFDASGSFEAVETIISAEATGTIKELRLEEGQALAAGETIGYIDSLQLHLKKKQLQGQIQALLSKKPDIALQLASLNEQLKTAEKEKTRTMNLIKGEAATTKQLDDITATIEVLKKQMEAQRSMLEISSASITKEAVPLYVQIEQLNDQLKKCRIVNPVSGTVLSKYAEQNEMTANGKPLYKVADLSVIDLRAYISGDQLPRVQLNQKVHVLTDDGLGGFKEAEGKITWINPKAEFTPKTIQTKNERANMVYAIKVNVKNDGTYKIGMYGEIKF